MIEFRKGDIFQSGCEAITNCVNCCGIMGAGLALAFKRRFPEMNKEYEMACQEGRLRPGIMHIWENPKGDPKYIVNFPTKDDLSPSRNIYITSGLLSLAQDIKRLGIKSIGIRALGSGLGGLAWVDVKGFIEVFAATIPDVHVVVYEPLE